MPKKRHSAQYSKPPSTAHPSLNIAAEASISSHNAPPPSVNQLIHNLRTQQQRLGSADEATPASKSLSSSATPSRTTTTMTFSTATPPSTLPPAIRHLLSVPETPKPRPRRRKRFDEHGRPLPAGPAPPQSWLHGLAASRYAVAEEGAEGGHAARAARLGRVGGGGRWLRDVKFLPWRGDGGFGDGDGGVDGDALRRHSGFDGVRERGVLSVRASVLRTIAYKWSAVAYFERYNLCDLPTRLRMEILSYVAIYGPEVGAGWEGLHSLLVRPAMVASPSTEVSNIQEEHVDNDDFYRLDLTYAIGRRITFKNLLSILTTQNNRDTRHAESEEATTWEEEAAVPRSPRPILPHLTHLSLAAPFCDTSKTMWPQLLNLAKHTPTVTHLSLAYWPVPSLTPNANTAYISHPMNGADVTYSGTGFYAHSIDQDWSEAADVIRRLANHWYGLTYLDLRGCTAWIPVLYWRLPGGVDWNSQWRTLRVIRLETGMPIDAIRSAGDIQVHRTAVKYVHKLDRWLKEKRGKGMRIEVTRDGGPGSRKIGRHVGIAPAFARGSILGDDDDDDDGVWPPPTDRTLASSSDVALKRSMWEQ